MDSLTLESAFQNRRSEWNNVACLRSPPNHADRQFTALNIGTKKPEPTTARVVRFYSQQPRDY